MRHALLVPAAALLLAMASLASVVSRPVPASAGTTSLAVIDALLDATGLKHQARLIASQTRQTLRSGLGGLRDADAEKVERITRWYFNPDAFYARLRAEFGRAVDDARLAETRAWFETPAGRRVAAADVRFYATDRRQEVEEFVARLAADPPPPARVALMQRLDAAAGTTEGSVELMVAVHRAIVRVMSPTLPADQRVGAGQLESQGRQIRLRMQEPLRMVSVATLLFVFRDVSDGDLSDYVEFLESDAGAWYGAATRTATIATIVSTVEGSAAEFIHAVPPERWSGAGPTPTPRRGLEL